MAFFVSCVREDALLDTLPALKLTHWYGEPGRGTVYCYGKLCLTPTRLRVGMWVFDGRPPVSQRAAAAFTFCPERSAGILGLQFAPDGGLEVSLCENGQTRRLGGIRAALSAGRDEQGQYWQSTADLPAELLVRQFGAFPSAGELFVGGMYLQDTKETAFGSAFEAKKLPASPGSDTFGEFVAVPY